MGARGPKAGQARQTTQTAIRLDPELRRRLDDAAKSNGVTFSDEVRVRLGASFGLKYRPAQAGRWEIEK